MHRRCARSAWTPACSSRARRRPPGARSQLTCWPRSAPWPAVRSIVKVCSACSAVAEAGRSARAVRSAGRCWLVHAAAAGLTPWLMLPMPAVSRRSALMLRGGANADARPYRNMQVMRSAVQPHAPRRALLEAWLRRRRGGQRDATELGAARAAAQREHAALHVAELPPMQCAPAAPLANRGALGCRLTRTCMPDCRAPPGNISGVCAPCNITGVTKLMFALPAVCTGSV
jgi:hypothetical protein